MAQKIANELSKNKREAGGGAGELTFLATIQFKFNAKAQRLEGAEIFWPGVMASFAPCR